jgi:ribulose-5-phosphate 4-epimerase/fuculose-1-phosphate aldolase
MAPDGPFQNSVPEEAKAILGDGSFEQRQRKELAACYRLCARFGWDDLIYTHISAALHDEQHSLLINPFGLRFDEMTASNLVRIDLSGRKLSNSPYDINLAGFLIHGAIHEARPDLGCVLHVHTEAGMAISMLEEGLNTRLSQHVARFHNRIAYHGYEGIVMDGGEKARLVADLSERKVMILRNHGFLTVGKTVGEAFTLMYYMEKAARSQLLASSGRGPLVEMSEEVAEHTARQFGDDQRAAGEAEWPAMLRLVARDAPECFE